MLSIYRPTLYKVIENYEGGDKHKLHNRHIAIFDYIQKSNSKSTVLSYIMRCALDEKDRIKTQANMACDNEVKQRFISLRARNSKPDSIPPYLITCHKILSKNELSSKDLMVLHPLVKLYPNLGLKSIILHRSFYDNKKIRDI